MSDNYNNEHIPQRPVKKSRKKSKERTAAFYDKKMDGEAAQAARMAAKEVKTNPPAKNRHGQKQ